MNESEREVEYVTQKLFKDNESITYSELSRVMDIPISRSKYILYDVFRSNKSKVDASFVIIGLKKGDKIIQYVESESDVNNELDNFEQILDVHIYAVTLSEYSYTKSDILLKQLDLKIDLGNLDLFYSMGHIKGPGLEVAANYINPSIKEVTPVKEERQESKKTSKSFNTGLSSNYVSRKAQKPETGADITKFASGNKRSGGPAKYQYKSRKLENKRDKVVVSDDTEPTELEEITKGIQKLDAESKTKLAAMFDDDFSDEEMADEPEEEIVTNNEAEDIKKDTGDDSDVEMAPTSEQNHHSRTENLSINKNSLLLRNLNNLNKKSLPNHNMTKKVTL